MVAVGRVLGLLVALGAGGAGWAHPFQSALYGHRLAVELSGENIVVDAVFEEPTPRVLAEYRVWADGQPGTPAEVMKRHTALRLNELEAGLSVAVDGEPVELVRGASAERSGVGGADFIRYPLRLEGALPAGWRQLSILDTAHPGEALASRWDLYLEPGLRLDQSSLWWEDRDLTGQWVTETPTLRCRELRLGITPLGAISRGAVILGEALGTPRPRSEGGLVEARWAKGTVVDGLRAWGMGLGAAVVVLVLAVLFGVVRRRRV